MNCPPGVKTKTSQRAVSQGFEPVIGGTTRVLILGSLPSQQSLVQQEYYANPRNAFWRIMSEIASVNIGDAYNVRCDTLINKGIALWDVLKSSVRPGSLDSSINLESAKENDIPGLLKREQAIRLIAFNGKKSRELFDRLVAKSWSLPNGVELVNLPSSSPAHAALRFEQKLELWSVIGRYFVLND